MKRLIQDMRFRIVIIITGIIMILIMYTVGIYHNLADIIILICSTVTMYIILQVLMVSKKVTLLTQYAFSFVDVFMISLLVIHSGGIHSPFYLIYIFILLYVGLSLDTKRFITFLTILCFLSYFYSILLVNYHREPSFESSDLIIAAIKLLLIIVFGSATMILNKNLFKQRTSLNKVLTENVNLSVKLKKFNQELIDRVITATNSLENEAALNMELYRKTQHLFINTTKALISAIDAKDPYTYGHTERMAKISLAIFDEYCLTTKVPEKEKIRETLELSSLLHDIGKIGIHDKVLLKPGSLNDKEWEEIKKHPIIGSNILESIKELNEVSEVISHHHEKYDGSGYISGLKGNEIPLLSRIIAIADAFDAMTSSRPYRKKMNINLALQEIDKNSGTQFDPALIEVFKSAYEKGAIK